MSDSKKKRLIGVIAAIAVIIVTVTGCNNSDEEANDPTTNDNITTYVTPAIEDNNPTESVTPQITDEPATPVVTVQPVETEPAKANLGAYKGIKANYSPKEISDEDVSNNLEKLQKAYSYYVKLPDRPFQTGDMAIVTINAFIEEKYQEDMSVHYYQVVLGSGSLPDFMEEVIVGSKKEEYRNVYYTYPEDFENKDIAGKTVEYNIKLVDGFELFVPEITDTFIKENTEYSTVIAYKTGMKEKLQKEENEKAYNDMLDSIKHTLITNCSYTGDIDTELKKAYVLKTQAYDNEAIEYGYPDAVTRYVYEYDMTSEDYQNMIRAEAEFDVKYQLALDEIITTEKLSDSYPEYSKEELRYAAEQLVIDSADIDGSLN